VIKPYARQSLTAQRTHWVVPSIMGKSLTAALAVRGCPDRIMRWPILPRQHADPRDADRTGLYRMRCFARNLRQDVAAVRNAITETWSNSQTERQTNRSKTLKRAMYGSAGVELLRTRMLPIRPTE
jgi:hypothetical protein